MTCALSLAQITPLCLVLHFGNDRLTYSRLVLETLQPLSDDRKCFRMINGVLTERTVKEVVPILQTNSDGLKKALEELVKQYKLKQDEMEKWKVRIPVFEFCILC